MFGRIGASVKNFLSGLGGSTDQAGADGYYPPNELSPYQIEEFMRVSIIRNVVECVPEDIQRAWRKFKTDDATRFHDIEKQFDMAEKSFEAMCVSKMYGGCAVLPLYVDSIDLSTPRLQSDKIVGFRIVPQHLVHTTDKIELYQIRFNNNHMLIHRSRVYLLKGKPRYDYSLSGHIGRSGLLLGQSEIDLVIEPFLNMMGSDQQIRGLLSKAIVDVRSQKGLLNDAEKASINPFFAAQFAAKQQHLSDAASYASNQQGVICDMDDEKVERLSVANGLGGLVVIPERDLGMFVAATGYPRTKVLGEQVQGLNNNGGADLRRYYDKVAQYREQKFWDLLRWMDGFVEVSSGVKFPQWEFGNLWEMTEVEKVDYENKLADRDKKYYEIFADAILEPMLNDLQARNIYPELDVNEIMTGIQDGQENQGG